MCGIFGIIGNNKENKSNLEKLANFAAIRGQDSSGILTYKEKYEIKRADFSISKLIKKVEKSSLFTINTTYHHISHIFHQISLKLTFST